MQTHIYGSGSMRGNAVLDKGVSISVVAFFSKKLLIISDPMGWSISTELNKLFEPDEVKKSIKKLKKNKVCGNDQVLNEFL